MAESLTDKLKLSKRDTGDINWGQGANANLDAVDQHAQQATLRPPRTLSASLGSGAVGANLLGSTTYFYKVTAVNVVGETTEGKIPAVLEAQVTESASPVPVLLSWETVKGATGYKIYKSTTSGQEKFLASVSGESTAIYTDDGNTATNGGISVPAANTARTSVSKIVAGTNVTISPVDGTGDVTINAPASAPIGAAGGDLSGTYPNPAVAKVNGTSVPASPSAGQVLTATGPTAATWQTPAGSYAATVIVATPTGVAATDTAAINAAISALPAAGGRVLLREGTYAVTPQIVIPASKPIWLMGQGKSSVLQPAVFGNGIFKGPASGNIDGLTFSDFHVDGSVSAGVGVIDLQPASGQTFDKIKVQRVTLVNGGRIVNIMATTGTGKITNVAILDCVSIDPQANGGLIFCNVAATGNASKIIVANNHVKQDAGIGIPLLQISGNDFLIENNYLEQPGGSIGDGIISFFGTTTKSAIVGNVFVGASAVGTGSSATISDCALSSNVADTLSAFVNSFALQGTTISNCTITGNKCAFPINLGASSSNNVIVGNKATISGGAASDNLVGNGVNTFNAVAVGSTAPTTGQVLTATSPTAAAWQTPAGGYAATQVVAAPVSAATDTANIQAALSAANTAGGGTVLLREGVYQINAPLIIPANTILRGQGKNATTLKAVTALGVNPILSSGFSPSGSNVGLRHLTVDLNFSVRGTVAVAADLDFDDSISMYDVRVTNSTSSGIVVRAINDLGTTNSIIDCEFLLNGASVLNYMVVSGGVIDGCQFTTSGAVNALKLILADSVRIIGNEFNLGSSSASASSIIRCDSGTGAVIIGNKFRRTAGTITNLIDIVASTAGVPAVVVDNTSGFPSYGTISITGASAANVAVIGNTGFTGITGGNQTGNQGQTTVSSGSAAGGDLSGTYPNPAVAKVNGTSVPASPSAGQVLTATGATAATWQTPSGGGYGTLVVAAPSGTAATDTTNIQNAINTVTAAGGGTVVLREGIYLISTTINPKSGVTIMGQGKSTGYNTGLSGTSGGGSPSGTTLRGTTGLGTTKMIADSGTAPINVTFRDLNLDFGLQTRGSIGSVQDMVMHGSNLTFRNVMFIGTCSVGNPAVDLTPTNTLDTGKNKFIGCDFYDGGTAATVCYQINGLITDCYFEGTSATFSESVAIVGGATITNCYFASNKNYNTGFVYVQPSNNATQPQMVVIANCIFKQYTTAQTTAIFVDNVTNGNVAIIGNVGDSASAAVGQIRCLASAGLRNVTGNVGFTYNGGNQNANDGQTAINSGGAAGGDLSGTYPNPTVAKVNGVAVTGTPTAGQVVTATGAVAATWQTPTPGGYATVVVAAPTGVAATDTANIQAALNSIPVASGGGGGGVVILRQGIYVVNQITIFNEGTKLSGSGPGFTPNRDASPGSSLQAANPLSADMLVILASQVVVENISFKGFGLAAGFALVSGNMGNTIFRDCSFVDIKAGNIGIKATTGQDLKILDCIFQIHEQSVITVARTPVAIKVGAAGGGFSQNVDIIGNHFMMVVEVSPTGAGSIVSKAIEMTKVFKAVIERNQIEGNSGFILVTGVTTIGVELFTDGSVESKGVVIGNNSGRSLNNFIRQTTGFPKVTVCGNTYIKHVGSAPVIDLVSGNTNWAIAGNVIEGSTGVNLAAGADSNVVAANIANVVNAGAGNSVVNNVVPL